MMVPMSQKDQRHQGDLIVVDVSAVKRNKTAGAVWTAGKEYAGMAELLLFVPVMEIIYYDSQ